MKSHFLLIVFLTFSYCNYSQSNTNTFQIGFETVTLLDSSRIYKPDTTEKELLHYRPVELDIWYPSLEQSDENLIFGDLFGLFEERSNRYQEEDVTGIIKELAQYYAVGLGLDVEDGDKLLNIKTDSYRSIQLARGKFPLIIYMAGYNGMGFENYKILEKLAENGYFVLSIWSVGRYPGNMTNDKLDTMEQVYDAEFAIDFLKNNYQFYLDFDNVGVLGCSWGGMSAAILQDRNPYINAMVSLDGTEIFYYGDSQEDDEYLNGIYEADLLHPKKITSAYYYMESGNKWDEFSPTDEYNYFKKLNSQKNYLRFLNGKHEDFTCFPYILEASESSSLVHAQIMESTYLFFEQHLKKSEGFNTYYDQLIENDDITSVPIEINLEVPSVFTLSGRVRDSNTNGALPYVSIGISNKEIGTVSNKNGNFNFNLERENIDDTLCVSMIGYKTKKILLRNLFAQNDKIQINLEEDISELDEIVIGAKGLKDRIIGNKTETKFLSTGFSYDQLGAEMGIRINVRKDPTYVDTFNFSVSHNRLSAKSIFRLNIYNIINGKPANNVLKNNIIIPIKAKQTGVISVDLTEYGIVLKDDVIVSLEWVENEGDTKKGEAIFFSLGLLTSGTYHKESSQGKLKKLNGLGVGFNMNVRY